MNPSASQLQEMLPTNRDISTWYPLALKLFPLYEINTPERIAGFVSQTAHESMDWTVISENLNYSAAALNRVFGKYFARAGVDAKRYHRQPEKIANRVYANRMDNGTEASGDGWRYRGRGLIQLTGKYNYIQFAESLNIPLVRAVEYLSTNTGALESALWFWKTNNLNVLSDRLDLRGLTKRINGGYNGLEDRRRRWRDALDIMQGDEEEYTVNLTQILRIGSKGETVKWAQEKLNITPDGAFGPMTQQAVMKFQKSQKLAIDGVLGPKTLSYLDKV